MAETISIVLCGDTLPARRLRDVPESARDIFRHVSESDLSLGNFEIPLTQRGSPVHKLLNIRAEPEIAQDVPDLGLDVVTIANNHAVDYGWDGLADTKQFLEDAGIKVVGAGKVLEEASRASFHTVGSLRIGILAFSCLTPAGMGAAPTRAGISPLHVDTGYEIDPWYQMEEPGDPSVVKIRTKIRDQDMAWAVELTSEARSQCDVLIVTAHWGYGSGDQLAEYQHPLAVKFIDAGADIIHGHHPHAIHAIGFHKDRPIIYSAGTYVGQQVFLEASPQVHQMWAAMSPDGFVTSIEYEGNVRKSIRIIPTTLDADRLPRRANPQEFDAILKRLQHLSERHGAQFAIDGAEIIVSAVP